MLSPPQCIRVWNCGGGGATYCSHQQFLMSSFTVLLYLHDYGSYFHPCRLQLCFRAKLISSSDNNSQESDHKIHLALFRFHHIFIISPHCSTIRSTPWILAFQLMFRNIFLMFKTICYVKYFILSNFYLPARMGLEIFEHSLGH